jgi:hypothetical protein
MYTYDGSYFAANGIMFHSNRPSCHEAYVKATGVSSSPNGTWIQFGGIAGEALSIVDTSALFGGGCDAPGAGAKYESAGVTAIGSSGQPGIRGGWVLMINSTGVNTFSGNPCALGAGWFLGNQQRQVVGSLQVGSTVYDNCAIAIDLLNVLPAATSANTFYQPGVLASDPASKKLTVAANTAPNTWGETPRFSQVLCGVSTLGTTVAAVPSPQSTFTSNTPITSTLMNNTVQQSLALLNNPPMLNLGAALLTTLPNNTATVVPYSNATLIDNYNGFNNTTHTYTVPLSGVYFCHANNIFSASLATGNCASGFFITPVGSTVATTMWGGNYSTTANARVNNGCPITRVLDLSAGDKIQAFAYQNSGGSSTMGNAYWSHLILVWMAALSPPSTSLTWTPPDVHGQLFHAGYPPGTASTQLVPLWNAKVANDLNFLINKPYMMAYQTTNQTGLSANTFHTVTMNTLGGMVHGSGVYDADNYNGWSAATSQYFAKVAGWYLVTCETGLTPNSTTAGSIVAGIANATSGTIANAASQSVDWYQHMVSVTGPGPSAPLASSLYYLLPGEWVSPQVMWQPNSGSGTTSTDVTNFNSNFSVIWICE